MEKIDIIKNIERIDSIRKSFVRLPMSTEDFEKGIEKRLPSIIIQFVEEIDGQKGIEIKFPTEEQRDTEFENMSNILDVKLFPGKK